MDDKKKLELETIKNQIKFDLTEEKFNDLKLKVFNSDFIVINDYDADIDKKIKKLVRKICVEHSENKYYQLFYYFTITFNNNKMLKLVMLNNEIEKFLNLIKRFIFDNSEYVLEDVAKKLKDFTFSNKNYIEDYKVLSYKYNLVSVIRKYEITNKVAYKSEKHFTPTNDDVRFVILKNDKYHEVEGTLLNNNKLSVMSNFLFMLKDLNIIQEFK